MGASDEDKLLLMGPNELCLIFSCPEGARSIEMGFVAPATPWMEATDDEEPESEDCSVVVLLRRGTGGIPTFFVEDKGTDGRLIVLALTGCLTWSKGERGIGGGLVGSG